MMRTREEVREEVREEIRRAGLKLLAEKFEVAEEDLDSFMEAWSTRLLALGPNIHRPEERAKLIHRLGVERMKWARIVSMFCLMFMESADTQRIAERVSVEEILYTLKKEGVI